MDYDVAIIGGGPAGLTAALTLARACRRVLVCDDGRPRNWASKKMYGFLSRDAITPKTFRKISERQLGRLEEVDLARERVAEVTPLDEGFVVHQEDGDSYEARKILLATGITDDLPPIPRVEEYFGQSVFQCPYCDGYQFRNRRLAAYGRGEAGFEMARGLTGWSRDVVLCTDGDPELSDEQFYELACNDIRVIEDEITAINGEDGKLRSMVLASGAEFELDALFFELATHQQSFLPQALGCRMTESGGVWADAQMRTSVDGVYVAGNAQKNVMLAMVAAAEGAQAAFAINKELVREDFARRVSEGLSFRDSSHRFHRRTAAPRRGFQKHGSRSA